MGQAEWYCTFLGNACAVLLATCPCITVRPCRRETVILVRNCNRCFTWLVAQHRETAILVENVTAGGRGVIGVYCCGLRDLKGGEFPPTTPLPLHTHTHTHFPVLILPHSATAGKDGPGGFGHATAHGRGRVVAHRDRRSRAAATRRHAALHFCRGRGPRARQCR